MTNISPVPKTKNEPSSAVPANSGSLPELSPADQTLLDADQELSQDEKVSALQGALDHKRSSLQTSEDLRAAAEADEQAADPDRYIVVEGVGILDTQDAAHGLRGWHRHRAITFDGKPREQVGVDRRGRWIFRHM